MVTFSVERARARRTSLVAMLVAVALGATWLVTVPFAQVAHAVNTYTVVSNGDQGGSGSATDGLCLSTAPGNPCTLRAAIREANGTAGLDIINFNIATPFKITLTQNLLPITDPVTIDGTSLPGFNPLASPVPAIVRVDGNSNVSGVTSIFQLEPATVSPLTAGSSGSTIKGLELVRASTSGIQIKSDNNTVSGNYIGTTAGSLALCGGGQSCSTYEGVKIFDGSGNTIGGTNTSAAACDTSPRTTACSRNTISNNGDTAVWITTTTGSSNNNVVQGNYLGTNATGTAAMANAWGVYQDSAGNPTGTQIGGTASGAGNVISGNGNYGVHIVTGTATIQGNIVGLDAAGTSAVPNYYGIVFADPAHDSTIGGATAAARNIISGNSYLGLGLTNSTGTSSNVTVQNNYIGTNKAGTADLGNGNDGLNSSGLNGLTVSNNTISGNADDNVEIDGCSGCAPATGVGATVSNNVLGLAADGAGALAVLPAFATGTRGIFSSDTTNLTISGNVISGNGYEGVYLNTATGATVVNNKIGTDTTGTVARPNANPGIYGQTVTNSVIGSSGAGNLISSNDDTSGFTNDNHGLYLYASNNVTIQGNTIGTNAAGTVAMGNVGRGIWIQNSSEVTVGGSGAGQGNLVANSTVYDGIVIDATNVSSVLGNIVGFAANGTTAMGNQGRGIWVYNSSQIQVGGRNAGEGNVVGNSLYEGIAVDNNSDDNTIQGNKVGVGADGTTPAPNGYNGITIVSGSDHNTVGGTAAGAGNTILNNTLDGIAVAYTSIGNTIRANSIDGNVLLGIDLAADGVTANDTGDADTGDNRLQNYPVLTSSASNASGTQVKGTLNSRPNKTYNLDFYASPACDASGNGEGASYLGALQVTTNGSGNVSFTTNLSGVAANGSSVTATATDASLGDTSEFSLCVANVAIPTVSINPIPLSVSESAGQATFTVDLSTAPTIVPVTVTYATADGTAGASDYTAQGPAVLTFNTGETQKIVNVPINSDNIDEADETFTITLSNPDNALIAAGAGSSTATILDDDGTPTILIADPTNVTETPGGVTQTFTVTLSNPSSQTITVVAGTQSGTATDSGDFTAKSGLITFVPGDTSEQFAVTVNDDSIDEPNETYTVNLFGPTNATIADGSATATIVDDDPTVTPTINIANATNVTEISGGVTQTFNVTLSQPSSLTVTVVAGTESGTATAGADFQSKSSVVTFVPGDTSEQFTVTVNDDTTDEPNESYSVKLFTPTNGTIGTGTATGTIVDNDPTVTPMINIADAAPKSENANSLQPFTVSLSAPSSVTVTVVAATAPDNTVGAHSAEQNSDFAQSAQVITFAPGQTSQTFNGTILGDGRDEYDETYQVNLFNASNGTIADGQAIGQILDNDAQPTLSVNDVTSSETDGKTTFTFTMTMSGQTGKVVEWDASTADGSATSGSDYLGKTNVHYTLTSGLTRTFKITVKGDNNTEPTENFFVNLTNLSNVSVGDIQGVGTITNDD